MLKRILATTAMLAVSACGTPEQATRLSDLATSMMLDQRAGLESYAELVNGSRLAAANRLSNMSAHAALMANRTANEELAWRLSGNKTALSMMKDLRLTTEFPATDVYAIAGVQSEIEAELSKRFGTLEVDTAAITAAIKKTREAVEPDRAAQFSMFLSIATKLFPETNEALETAGLTFQSLEDRAVEVADRTVEEIASEDDDAIEE